MLLLLGVLIWRWPTEVGQQPKTAQIDTLPETQASEPNVMPRIAVVIEESPGKRYKEIFKKHLGIREVPMGSNSGPAVDSILSYCYLPPKNQWCAATASKMLGLAGIPNPRSGYTPSLVPKSKVIFKSGDSWTAFVSKYENQFEDMALVGSLYVPAKKRDGHLFGIAYVRDEYIYTYEGNVNDMCVAKKRHYSTISKICNFTPDESTY